MRRVLVVKEEERHAPIVTRKRLRNIGWDPLTDTLNNGWRAAGPWTRQRLTEDKALEALGLRD